MMRQLKFELQRQAIVWLSMMIALLCVLLANPDEQWRFNTDKVWLEVDTGYGHLEEDDPGWNCRTMGNRFCGNLDMGVVPL
jgi:hypothetical protein